MGTIGSKLIEVGWRANDDQSQAVRLAADFADTSEWAAAGYSTAGRWIAEMLEVAPRTANEWIRVGRCLRELAEINQALADRVISFTKAKELTRSATPENEQDLLALAETVPASELSRAIAAWLRRYQPDELIDARQKDARSMTWQTQADGMVTIYARLPPGQAGVVIASVDSEVMRLSQMPRDEHEEWASLSQQRADALVDVLGTGGGDLTTELVLHIRGDGATLDDGTPITESAAFDALGDGFIRALIHDAEGRPINASGRQRHPTARQRRVVKERDRGCLDCGSLDLLEYDHVPDYAETKHTVIDELELRCATCHRFRHHQAS